MSKIIKGEIKNVHKQVLTNVVGGEISSHKDAFGKITKIKGGKTHTTHEHYTDFTIDNAVFRCYGDYFFADGDKVALCPWAFPQDNGIYNISYFYNATRDVLVSEEEVSPILRSVGWFLAIAFISTTIAEFSVSAMLIGYCLAVAAAVFFFRRNSQKNKDIQAFNEKLCAEGKSLLEKSNN